MGPSALVLWQGLAVSVLLTPFRARSCVMGTSPAPRDINAAALAVATPAVETSREVGWLFGEGILGFQRQFGREWSAAFLFICSREELQSYPSSPPGPLNPKQPLSQGQGPSWALNNQGKAAGGSRNSP